MKILFTLRNTLRLCVAGLLLGGLSASLPAAPITGFDDITYWVGSGSNQAALVIDWNDGISPVSLAWGFRWDGLATGQDMMLAIAGATYGDLTATGADPRLSIYVTSYGFGNVIDRIVYDGAGFEHDSAGFVTGGYWEYLNMGGSFDTPPDGDPNTFPGSSSYPGTGGAPDWISSWTGFTDRQLSDGAWDAWSFAPDFVNQPVDVPVAAVPEPSVLAVLLPGLAVVFFRRRLSRC